MFKLNLAASGNASLKTASARQVSANRSLLLRKCLRTVRRFDRQAQKFLNTQATVRGRKTPKVEWGHQRHEGFF